MARPRTPRRVQLGEFLAARRKAQDRAELGLPPAARRGGGGLSREELATLAGISVSWYTWLEQGRDINASRQVLDAVARVLRLTDDERDYVRALADPEHAGGETPEPEVPAHLARLVDGLEYPAFVVGADWSILAWNARYEWLYGPITSVPEGERNLLWLVYTDPRLRELLPDWDRDSRRFLAEFRAEAGVRLGSARHRALVERLRERSAEFRAHWAEHVVERFASRRRAFAHPDAGLVVFEYHRLAPSDSADLHVVIYVPVSPYEPAGEQGAVRLPLPTPRVGR